MTLEPLDLRRVVDQDLVVLRVPRHVQLDVVLQTREHAGQLPMAHVGNR